MFELSVKNFWVMTAILAIVLVVGVLVLKKATKLTRRVFLVSNACGYSNYLLLSLNFIKNLNIDFSVLALKALTTAKNAISGISLDVIRGQLIYWVVALMLVILIFIIFIKKIKSFVLKGLLTKGFATYAIINLITYFGLSKIISWITSFI